MNVDECLERFGLTPSVQALPSIRQLLDEQTKAEHGAQGEGDTELMKLLCVQLFSAASPEDVLRVWRAKTSSMDAACSIDVQLLCGAGLGPTKALLEAVGTPDAYAALDRLRECEAAGDFVGFTPEASMEDYAVYYDVDEPSS